MTAQNLTLEEVKSYPVETLLRGVVEHQLSVTVLMPDGSEVMIEPRQLGDSPEERAAQIPTGREANAQVVWQTQWQSLAASVSQAWQSDKSALETLAEMRR